MTLLKIKILSLMGLVILLSGCSPKNKQADCFQPAGHDAYKGTKRNIHVGQTKRFECDRAENHSTMVNDFRFSLDSNDGE